MDEFFKDKKVLITGHTGFKGSWLTQILLNFGATIVGISLPPDTSPNLFEVLKIKDKVKNYFIDVRDFEAVKKIFTDEQPEIVFHLAAQPIVRLSYDYPLETISTNILGTAHILQAIKEVGGVKSAVIITTDKVYKNIESHQSYSESDPLGGYDPYSSSKAAADIITNSYIQSFFNPKDFKTKHNTLIAIARAGNVIGGGDWASYRLVPDIIRSIYEKEEVIMLRNPESIRPWEHVLEPLSGYLNLAKGLYENKSDYSGPWNFGPNDESFISVKQLTEEAIEFLGKGSIDIKSDSSKHETNILKLDITKVKSVLNWYPTFDFKQNLGFTFSWYKNYYEKTGDIVEFTNQQIKSFFNK